MAYTVEKFDIECHGESIAAELFRPNAPGPHPAVVIIGPVAFVKEQSPLQYATRLAQNGIAALIFDPRYYGASTGDPRQLESGVAKIEDLRATLDYLAQRDDFDRQRLGVLGICQGVNWAISAALEDSRVSSLALVAGHYLTPGTALMYLGDPETVSSRIERSAQAQAVFDDTSEVRYIEITGSENALLTAPPVMDWYAPWANHAPWFAHRGKWNNQIAAMSEANIWNWRTDETMAKLNTPLLMVHSEKAATGHAIPQQLFATVPTTDKSLHWIDNANQLQFYEYPPVIDAAVAPVIQHFKTQRSSKSELSS